jgi:hypothetical protein
MNLPFASQGTRAMTVVACLSDNEDEGFKGRALIALSASKIIKKRQGNKKMEAIENCCRKQLSNLRQVVTGRLGENIGCHQGLLMSWLIC